MTVEWAIEEKDATGPEDEVPWHMVKEGATKTLCGLDVPNPDEEWRWAAELSNHRPCDNCTEINARKV